MTDRLLAVVGGRWAEGAPGEILTTETMSELYKSPIEVLQLRGRVVVLADTGDPLGSHHDVTELPKQAGSR